MPTPAMVVECLGKKYLLGQRQSYKTIRESMSNLRNFARRRGFQHEGRGDLWALRDVSFTLERGEVLGVIGHNGAGKSTLLKILSRVTCPTEGRATLHGRASALLEIGTGFHPELTGRENVFLNGSVLGMRKAEIARKFAAMVEFSEIGEFIDTPIKRYSSGMQVRLAFAVAAFLEPEILIVDEVLAVGDVAFQRKCLGKLGTSALEGRTVLFVSHNLQAVRTLCSRSVVLDRGRLVFDGNTDAAVDNYLSTQIGSTDTMDLKEANRPNIEMGGRMRLVRAELVGATEVGTVPVGHSLIVRIEIDVRTVVKDAVLALNVLTLDDVLVAQSVTTNSYRPIQQVEPGSYLIDAHIESALLQPGRYTLGFGARSSAGVEDHVSSGGMVEFVESADLEFPWFGGPGGYLRLPVTWSGLQPATDLELPR